MLGLQPANIVDAVRAIWRLQNKIDLDDTEAQEVGFDRETREHRNGASLYPRPYEFSDGEAELIRGAMRSCNAPPNARPWLQPLLDAFFPEAN